MNNVYSLHHVTRHKSLQFIPNVWLSRQLCVPSQRQNIKQKEYARFHDTPEALTFGQGRLHLENKNKSEFILYFTRFTLPLTFVEGTHVL